MMTEEEAKTKWCPHVRLLESGDTDNSVAGINAYYYDRDPAKCLCIGSRCMAWRWIEPEKMAAIKKHRDETGCSVSEAKEYVDRERPELTMRPTHGYCGLAGRP